MDLSFEVASLTLDKEVQQMQEVDIQVDLIQ